FRYGHDMCGPVRVFREKAVIVPFIQPGDILRKMDKGQVMKSQQYRDAGPDRSQAVRGKINVYLVFFQRYRDSDIRKQVVQERMPCLRTQHYGPHIGTIYELLMIGPVKEKIEFMLRVSGHYT